MRTAGCFNDVYAYEPNASVWTNLTGLVAGTPPAVRGYMGFEASGERLYVFGGYSDVAGAALA